MITADFLPPHSFRSHLDRRRTPRRLTILSVFSVICVSGTLALDLEVHKHEKEAIESLQPNEEARIAQQDLNAIYASMSEYAYRLDPLTSHLSKPLVFEVLAGLAGAVGQGVEIEEIEWRYLEKFLPDGKTPVPVIEMNLLAVVQGEGPLMTLDERLLDFTGYEEVFHGKTTTVDGRPNALRKNITIRQENPPIGDRGGKAPKTLEDLQ